ncbi:MAG: Hint domain-containing protein [Rhodobacterales bacterium]|nr:Hint domain-containing protein [Rhodobacterales bacterium]MDX5413851.1 Hint domain-containing protein [Rhodobacterales bacterium]
MTLSAQVPSGFDARGAGPAVCRPEDRPQQADDIAPLPGLVAGTRVLTADGISPVELLGPGDRIITRNAGTVRLAGLRFHQHRGDFLQIPAGALGASRPDTDTILASTQIVFIRDASMTASARGGRLIRAADLPPIVGGAFLRGVRMTVVELMFDSPQLVYADGLETLCDPARQRSLAA